MKIHLCSFVSIIAKGSIVALYFYIPLSAPDIHMILITTIIIFYNVFFSRSSLLHRHYLLLFWLLTGLLIVDKLRDNKLYFWIIQREKHFLGARLLESEVPCIALKRKSQIVTKYILQPIHSDSIQTSILYQSSAFQFSQAAERVNPITPQRSTSQHLRKPTKNPPPLTTPIAIYASSRARILI